MFQERHRNIRRKAFIEDFRSLLTSDYWQCLPDKTKESILSILAEYQGEFVNRH